MADSARAGTADRPGPTPYGYPRRPQRVVRVNHRLVLILLACTALLGVGMHVVHDYQMRRNADALLERARAAEKQGELPAAVDFLSQYVRLRPCSVDALARLGRLVDQTSNDPDSWRRVYLTYSEVLRRDPKRDRIRRKLVDVAMRLTRYRDALDHLEVLRNATPGDAALMTLAGRCHERLGNAREAAESYVKAIRSGPVEPGPYVRLALLIGRRGDQLPLQRIAESIAALAAADPRSPAQPETPDPEPGGPETSETPLRRSAATERGNQLGGDPAGPSRPFETTVLADRVLRLMVQRGASRFPARLARAEFYATRASEGGERPEGAESARRQIERVLGRFDGNGDGVLDRREWGTLAVMPTVVDRNQDDVLSRDELLQRYRRGEALALLDQARRDLEAAEAQDGERTDLLRTAATVALARSRAARRAGYPAEAERSLQQAREDAERGLATGPADPRFSLLLAQIARADDRPEEADELLRTALERFPEIRRATAAGAASDEIDSLTPADWDRIGRQLLFTRADLLISRATSEDGRVDGSTLDEARRLLDRLREAGAGPAFVRFLRGRIRLAQREWHRASLIFESIRPELRPRRELVRRIDLALGRCYERLHNPDRRLLVFRRALEEDPLWTRGRVELASALADLNRIEDALDEYRTIRGVPGVPVQIARLLLLRKHAEADVIPPEAARSVEEALDAEVSLRERYSLPASPDVPLLRARSRMHQNKWSEAERILERARDEHPEEVRVRTALVHLALNRRDVAPSLRIDNAKTRLQRAVEKLGDRAALRIAAAEVAVRQPVDTARRSLAELEAETAKFPRGERARLLEGLARAYGRIGARKTALRHWRRAADLQPNDLEVRLILVQWAIEQNDEPAVTNLLAEIRMIEGSGGPNGNSIEARWLMRRARRDFGGSEDADQLRQALQRPRTLLHQAAEQRPTWAAVPRALGRLETLLDNREAAVRHYRRAISLGDRSREAIARVAEHLYHQQRFEEADRILKRFEAESGSSLKGNLARLAWRISWRRRRHAEALGIAESLAEQSGKVQDKIWSARLRFARVGRDERVRHTLQKAVDSAVQDHPEMLPTAYFALIAYLARTGQIQGEDGAAAVLREAADTMERNAPERAALTLARCCELLHSVQSADARFLKRAEEYYLRAVASKPGEIDLHQQLAAFYARHGRRAKAERELDSLLNPKTGAPAPVVNWARRTKARLMATNGTYADTREGLELLEQSMRRSGPEGPPLDDLRAKAAILAQSNLRRHRRELIDVLEQIDERRPLSPADRFRLARLYEMTGNWERSAEILQSLMDEHPTNGLFLAQYLEGLIEHGRLEQAETRLADLKDLMPDSFLNVLLRARLLAAQGRSGQAVPIVREFLQRQDRAESAGTLEELLAAGRVQEALNVLERQAEPGGGGDAQDDLDRARRLLVEGERDEAAGVLEGVVRQKELELRVQNFYERAAARLLDELGQPAAAEDIFHRCMQRSDRPADVLSLVSYVAHQGRTDEALELCRDAWENEQISEAAVAGTSVAVLRHAQNPSRGQVARVERRLQAALQEDPGSAAGVFLADLRDFQGRYDEAERIYRSLLEHDSGNLMAMNNLAWLWALRGKNLQQALQHVNRAIDRVGPQPELLDTRAVVSLALGDPRSAVKDLENAVADSPSASLYFHLARAYWQLGNAPAARNAYEKARQAGDPEGALHPLEKDVYRALTKHLARRG